MPLSPPVQSRLAAGAIRTAPLEGETTASWITRCAARYHLPASPYLRAVLQQEGRATVSGRSALGAELYLNAAARERVAAYSRIEEQVLARVLPAWPLDLDVLRHHTGPAAHWQSPTTHTAASVMAGCLKCTAPRSRGQQVWQYRGRHQRVCHTHRIWLVGGEAGYTGPTQIPLDHLGQHEAARILAAHRRHQDLTDPGGIAAEAWLWARGTIQHLYTDQKLMSGTVPVSWNKRLDALAAQAGRMGKVWPWWIIARDLVTYPETFALAEALTAMTADADAYQHAAAEEHLAGLLSDALRTNTGPDPADEAGTLARWLARHARSELQRWLNSRHGDASAAPLHVAPLTWALKRHADRQGCEADGVSGPV
ncbi:TniQ family protein [Streptomyces sp. ML-6]|uniref:TniQ family protein n=1 Tax=Streptomyces sp. ML-6 TaxID=2982693 RepID=UPI0024BF92B4|nr:TniQ family protein [Streptomyces sp. ML-6]MDK0517522.1 TniQ family protein [Streptomyces sp. ML-6]MDK0524032.1 TniQ family protein [Streptomyces sp. ML-6]MDK0524912.1 TniQ family protein [Streptomyces sp. ML-6]